MYYLNMWFRENLGLKIISLLIAVCLWAYVMVRNDSLADQTFDKARIVLVGVPRGLTVVECNPTVGKVEISGVHRLLQRLSPGQVFLTADVTGQDVGTHTITLAAPTLAQGLEAVTLTPTTVQITLDKTVTETHEITVHLRGEPASGYVFGSPAPSPAEAKVTGAATVLARLGRLVAVADASGLSAATVRTRVSVTAVDDQGNPLPGVRVDPDLITVAVDVIRGSEMTKTVPVHPQLHHAAEGYDLSSVTAHPDEITLSGSPDALAHLDSVATEAIPVEEVTTSGTYQVKPILPEGVKWEGGEQIEVTVTVVKHPSGTPAETTPGAAPPKPAETPAPAPSPPPAAPPPGSRPAPPSGEGQPSPPRTLPGG
jgi:YbbR domain-containing protein